MQRLLVAPERFFALSPPYLRRGLNRSNSRLSAILIEYGALLGHITKTTSTLLYEDRAYMLQPSIPLYIPSPSADTRGVGRTPHENG